MSKPETSKQKIGRVKVIVSDDTDLVGALTEAEWIKQFARNKGLEVTSDSTYEELLTTLETTMLAARKTSMPAPEPRSTTVSHSLINANLVSVPQPAP